MFVTENGVTRELPKTKQIIIKYTDNEFKAIPINFPKDEKLNLWGEVPATNDKNLIKHWFQRWLMRLDI